MLTNSRSIFTIASILSLMTACGKAPIAKDEQDQRQDTTQQSQELAEEASQEAIDFELAPALVPTTSLKLLDLSASGTGCPTNTVASNISPDSQAFTAIFSSFVIAVQPENKPKRAALNCKLVANVELPEGWRLAVTTIDQRGYAELAKGSRAKLTTNVAFADGVGKKKVVNKIVGPYAADFQFTSTIKIGAPKWSRCGGQTSLEIDLDAVVIAKKEQSALLTMDSIDGQLDETLKFKWQKCK